MMFPQPSFLKEPIKREKKKFKFNLDKKYIKLTSKICFKFVSTIPVSKDQLQELKDASKLI